ncbi:MAG: hypothetical protein HY879_22790 [Deltaproteobacteria bacterium]|nr:hypothetical protein [Deltaproteobacteria bacterium]
MRSENPLIILQVYRQARLFFLMAELFNFGEKRSGVMQGKIMKKLLLLDADVIIDLHILGLIERVLKSHEVHH